MEKIIHTVNHLGERVHQMEELLMGKDHSVATQQFLHANSIGRLLFAHKLNIYLTSVQETQLRLYDELERVLREFLSAVRIPSKGYLPASLFPPTILCRITSNALQMVQKKNPDYVLMIKHVTEYYDMKMVTFGVNDSEELVVAFPVFVQDLTRESMTLYEFETVKVPITDTNLAANSYTEVETSKPYIAFNNDYYIQLRIPELHMCKQIWHSYYCEELFLVKHKSKHSCESAIYYNLSEEVINEYCSFKVFLQHNNHAQCSGWRPSRYFWPIFSLPRGSYVHTHQICAALYPVMTMSSSTGLFFVIVIWNQASHTYLNLLLFVKLLVLTIPCHLP